MRLNKHSSYEASDSNMIIRILKLKKHMSTMLLCYRLPPYRQQVFYGSLLVNYAMCQWSALLLGSYLLARMLSKVLPLCVLLLLQQQRALNG
jgi:hypothetical protein